jgi:hypothetical protein
MHILPHVPPSGNNRAPQSASDLPYTSQPGWTGTQCAAIPELDDDTSVPRVDKKGVAILDWSARVSQESRERQYKAADAYMIAHSAARLAGATFKEAAVLGRRAFRRSWDGSSQ